MKLLSEKFVCKECGKIHDSQLRDCVIEKGALNRIPEFIIKYGASNPYILCDINTYKAAGERLVSILKENGIAHTCRVINKKTPAPDENTVGEGVMYCPADADMVIGVGGGVINDTSKIIAGMKKVPMIIAATAPSMDGFASATSSMERSGFKISLQSKCPDCVIGDTEILATAPAHLVISGIGDMLAKYISITEWKIARLVIGEYYCENVASMVQTALEKCVSHAKDALAGNEEALKDVMGGLVISGVAMNYAGISRPASGMEHYISHIIEMRSLEFSTPKELHGIQCGIAALYTVRLYERLAEILSQPVDVQKAITHAEEFNSEAHFGELRKFLGRGAEIMIENEIKEGRYDTGKHKKRLENIVTYRSEIIDIINELPKSDELEKFMKEIGHPTNFEEIGLKPDEILSAIRFARDVRDKYILGGLLWDLGIEL